MSDENLKPTESNSRPTEETRERGAYKDEAMHAIHSQLMREKEEPTEGFSQMPIFLLFIFGALMFWGGIYIANYSGEFRSDVFDPNWTPGSMDQDLTQAAFDLMKKGKKLFARQCQQCHQAEGQGIPGVYPPLAGSEWVVGDERLPAKILLLGMNGPITVKGESYNGNMPPVGMWSDRDIASVLSYIRYSWGNEASMVEETTVAAVRKELEGRNAAWTPEELLQQHLL